MPSSLQKLALAGILVILSSCIPLPQEPAAPAPTPEAQEATEETTDTEEEDNDETSDEALEVEVEEESDADVEEEAVPPVEELPAAAPAPAEEPDVQPLPPAAEPEPSADPAPTPEVTAPAVREVVIDVTNWSFTPSVVNARQGEQVVLVLKGGEGIHGFAVPDLGINETVAPGDTVRVPLPTINAGTFSFFCSIPCGAGHSDMWGRIEITV